MEMLTRSQIMDELKKRRDELEANVVRVIVEVPQLTYVEIGKVFKLHPVRVGQIAAKHGVQRQRGVKPPEVRKGSK